MAFKEKVAAAQGGEANRRVAAALKEKGLKEQISCADAESIARGLNEEMAEVGRNLDLLGVRIFRCQLGLFGYGEGEEKKVLKPAPEVAPEMQQAVTAVLVEGRLPCRAAWEIAGRLGVPRMAVAAAGEAMGLKVRPCQLGAF
jgi:hypothetical protein